MFFHSQHSSEVTPLEMTEDEEHAMEQERLLVAIGDDISLAEELGREDRLFEAREVLLNCNSYLVKLDDTSLHVMSLREVIIIAE